MKSKSTKNVRGGHFPNRTFVESGRGVLYVLHDEYRSELVTYSKNNNMNTSHILTWMVGEQYLKIKKNTATPGGS